MTQPVHTGHLYESTTRAALDKQKQLAENSARQAFCNITYITRGAGQIIEVNPLPFDATFLDEPGLSYGSVLRQLPNLQRYKYPRTSAGVYRWQRNDAGHYIGAYVYFVVDVPAVRTPRTDGSNLDQLRAYLLSLSTADPEYPNVVKLIQEAEEAQFLLANPPAVEVIHHLTFSAVALKGLPASVMSGLADPAITPRSVNYRR